MGRVPVKVIGRRAPDPQTNGVREAPRMGYTSHSGDSSADQNPMKFDSKQGLNQWVVMLHDIYGRSQNYAKTPYEIHAHLTEVCGVFAKHLFKRKDVQRAQEFLPKMFAWATALLKTINRDRIDLEEIILRKFPNSCSYCLARPCSCWKGEKPTLDENRLRNLYYQNKASVRRSVNDFQLMFGEIYSASWSTGEPTAEGIQRRVFIRLIEELAELGESVRFHHLYPENFENELADFFAWWFALVWSLKTSDESGRILAEDCLWRAYPGYCPDCQMLPCLCRPGPVRQLMSKPIPGDDHRYDALTSALNQAAYNEDLKQIAAGFLTVFPTISCARIDVDSFKIVNDTYGHPAGDEALRHIAAVIRKTVRERDRVYRISGDEFGVFFSNFTEEEAAGAMRRVCEALSKSPVRWIGLDGAPQEFVVSVSIGVAESSDGRKVEAAFAQADSAAYASKRSGKGRVTRASDL
jgi:diguanylate cyclase (GGDEF)-like protein